MRRRWGVYCRPCRTEVLLVLLLAAGTGLLPAQTYEQVAPQVPTTEKSAVPLLPETLPSDPVTLDVDENAVLVPTLRGLVFVATPANLRPTGTEATGVVTTGVAVLDESVFRERMQPFLGEPVTLARLRAITREAVLHLRTHDRPLVDVLMPEQDISNGTVQLLVLEGRLGRVSVEGNRWFNAESYASVIRVQPGEIITGSSILQDVGWLNQNPFRQVDLVFRRGDQSGETDVILRANDRRPWRIYAGVDDSGNELTGDLRMFVGANAGNLFGHGQQGNYQLTASPDFERLMAHSGSYMISLPWRHTLTFFGSYAESRPELADSLFDLEGVAWQASGRYHFPLPDLGRWRLQLMGGLDFKRSNNNLAFGGTQVFAQSTDVVQAVMDLSSSRSDDGGTTSLGLTLTASPGGLTSHNSDSAFATTRSMARADYIYGRLQAERLTRLPNGWQWKVRGLAQWASVNLLGSEQFGLGGVSSVRGFEEREANGDSGLLFGSEIWLPTRRIGPGRLQVLAFVEGGVARLHDPLLSEDDAVDLASVGIGLRYMVAEKLWANVAYGHQIRQRDPSMPDQAGRFHFSFQVSY